jgi:hypothetical protein
MRDGGGPNCCADAEPDGGGPDPVAVAPSVIAVDAPSVIAVRAPVIAVVDATSVIAAVEAPCVIAASTNPCRRVCGSDGNRASRQRDGKYKGTRSTGHFTFLSNIPTDMRSRLSVASSKRSISALVLVTFSGTVTTFCLFDSVTFCKGSILHKGA